MSTAHSPWLKVLSVFLAILLGGCSTIPTGEFPISEEQARLRVERLLEVGPSLRASTNMIVELDRGPTTADPYYHFWFGQKVPPPSDPTGTISRFAVDARTGKVYRSSTFEEIPE